MTVECGLYSDPELYDSLFPNAGAMPPASDDARRERIIASERFYLEQARESVGRVLELACGSGRLTIPIAQSGIDIIGADLSHSMIERARAKAVAAGVRVQFVEADMRNFNLGGPFAAIFIPGNSLLHLMTIEDLKQCLECVRRHLAPGGRLVFDISQWDLSRFVHDPSQRFPVMRLNHPELGEVAIEETARYDAAAQVREITWYLSAQGAPDFRVIEYRLRVIFPQELRLLLEATGFRVEKLYGEFTCVPFESSSPRQVCVCGASTPSRRGR